MDDYNRHTNVWTNITGLTFERNDHTGFLVVTSSLQQVDTILYPHPTPLPIGPTVSLTLSLYLPYCFYARSMGPIHIICHPFKRHLFKCPCTLKNLMYKKYPN